MKKYVVDQITSYMEQVNKEMVRLKKVEENCKTNHLCKHCDDYEKIPHKHCCMCNLITSIDDVCCNVCKQMLCDNCGTICPLYKCYNWICDNCAQSKRPINCGCLDD